MTTKSSAGMERKWLFVPVALLAAAGIFWAVNISKPQSSTDQDPIVNLNKLLSIDKDIDEKLALFSAGMLSNYDGVAVKIMELEMGLRELPEQISSGQMGDNQDLQRRLDDAISRFQQKKQTIEDLVPNIAPETVLQLEQIGFHSVLMQLLTDYVAAYENYQTHSIRMQQLLSLIVLLLIGMTGAAFYGLRSQKIELQKDNVHRQRINASLEKLAEFDHKSSSHSFFDVCVQNLAQTCGTHVAFIALFEDESKTRLQTQSVWLGDANQENFIYDLKGTPCQNVVTSGGCFVERDVADLYAEDVMLADLGIESYFGKILVDPQGEPLGVVSLMNDSPSTAKDWIRSLLGIFATRISIEIERSKNLATLSKQKEQVITTLNSIADGVMATDEEGVVTSLNPLAEKMLGINESWAGVGQAASQLFRMLDDNEIDVLECPVEQCLETRKTIVVKGKSVLVASTGETLPVKLSAAPILDTDDTLLGVIVVLHDVSQERQFRTELAYQASHDDLTGLLNRRALEDELQGLLQNFNRGDCHSLIYVDLDRFKIVNDTCGHSAGDELLCKFADQLRMHVREADILARLGGDEFFLVLKNCRLERSKSIAENILKQLETFRFFWGENEFSISASIGLMAVESSDYTFTELMSMVDLACLKAKNMGRNKLCVSEPDNSDYTQRKGEMLWIPRLRNAIDQNLFQLYQQPIVQVGLLSGRTSASDLSHVEILLRVKDKDSEKVMLYQLVSAAERYGMMVEIDRWVIKNTLERMAGNGLETTLRDAQFVSINLSGQSLAQEDLLDFIQHNINGNDLDPSRICFEITETNAIANYTNATRLMRELRAMGCQFALDDFGSGLSSYSYIKNLPADYLKIDREFTKDLATEPINQAIVRSVIDVAKNIGMKSIAEGVETEQTLDLIKQFGADYVQGFQLGHPQPVDTKH